jgi:hypothetical protein
MTDSAVRIGARSSNPTAVIIAGWAAAVALYAAEAIWIALHHPAVSSDDALFLLRGLSRFSVLDFSPQFPGYPGFIVMGRLLLPLADDPLRGLALLTGMVALAIPPLAALVAGRNAGGVAALAAFILALVQPLAPDLGLSLLTDGSGILFLLVFLALLPRAGEETGRARSFLAGAALAWALACRPSDAVLFAGAAIGAVAAARRIVWPAILGGLAVLVPVVAVVAALEGHAYLDEGLRFLAGHATLWGNTALWATPHDTWLTTIGAMPGGLALAAVTAGAAALGLGAIRQAPPALIAATVGFAAYAIWVAAFQNPDQLRHLAPLLVLAGLIVAMLLPRGGLALPCAALMLGLEVWSLAAGTVFDTRAAPPLAAATAWLGAQPETPTVATNLGVETLRGVLPHARIYDAYYAGDAALGLATATDPAYRLTTTPLAGQTPTATFPGRFAGEPGLLAYRAN